MALVDTLLFTDPAAALDTLATLPDSIKDPETVAWRNLLSAKASSKAFQPLPSDTILARTANFYNGRGDSLETQSRYYYGYKLLLNNNYDTALVVLSQTYSLAEANKDFFYMAVTARAIGDIYSSLLIPNEEFYWADKSINFFRRANKQLHAACAELTAINALLYINKDDAIERFTQIAPNEYRYSEYYTNFYNTLLIDIAYIKKNYKDVILLSDSIRKKQSLDTRQWCQIAESHLNLKNISSARHALDSAFYSINGHLDSIKYYHIKSKLLTMTGDYQQAYRHSNMWSYEMALTQQKLLTNHGTKRLTDFYKLVSKNNKIEKELSERKYTNRILITSGIIALLIIIIIFLLLLKSKKEAKYYRLKEEFNTLQNEIENISELKMGLKKLFENNLNIVNNVIGQYYLIPEITRKNNSTLSLKLKQLLDNFTSVDMLNSIELTINKTDNNWMTRFRTEYPNLPDDDYKLTMYLYLGFKPKFIGILMNKTDTAVNSAKLHMKERILKVSSNMQDDVLKKLRIKH